MHCTADCTDLCQVYNYHRLLSWDQDRGLHMDIYKVMITEYCCSTDPPAGPHLLLLPHHGLQLRLPTTQEARPVPCPAPARLLHGQEIKELERDEKETFRNATKHIIQET